ncbi:MAG: 50S ribosomal protein L11 methyltransferase [Bacteroidetes bacterium]|nr:50S ribosomal protein L11 methyltransferase [Bacteroidota bacterium]
MKYLELSINVFPREPWNEIFVSDLSQIGFESFQDDADGTLKAYIQEPHFSDTDLKLLLEKRKKQINFNYHILLLEEKNWNKEWESQFEPVNVDDCLEIIAPFHIPQLKDAITIVIEPKMTFGTGHHQTTHLICAHLLKYPPKNECVLDMGTGTGVLAILSEILGASAVTAIEIEEWSVENALENIRRNACKRIELIKGSKEQIPNIKYDLIIANINRNVLSAQLPIYASRTKSGGKLLISGFFTTDNKYLIDIARENAFEMVSNNQRDEWSIIQFVKQ